MTDCDACGTTLTRVRVTTDHEFIERVVCPLCDDITVETFDETGEGHDGQ